MQLRARIGAFMAAAFGWLGCDDGGAQRAADSGDTGDTGDTIGAEVASTLAVTAEFASATPSVGQHHLAITVKNGAGEGLAGAAVTVLATMPTMGHGSTETPVVTDQGGGTYDAYPVTMQMPGAWRVDASPWATGSPYGLKRLKQPWTASFWATRSCRRPTTASPWF